VISPLRGFGRWAAFALPVVLLPLRWIGCSRDPQFQCLGILVALKLQIRSILYFPFLFVKTFMFLMFGL
jgi:hypothetical protein